MKTAVRVYQTSWGKPKNSQIKTKHEKSRSLCSKRTPPPFPPYGSRPLRTDSPETPHRIYDHRKKKSRLHLPSCGRRAFPLPSIFQLQCETHVQSLRDCNSSASRCPACREVQVVWLCVYNGHYTVARLRRSANFGKVRRIVLASTNGGHFKTIPSLLKYPFPTSVYFGSSFVIRSDWLQCRPRNITIYRRAKDHTSRLRLVFILVRESLWNTTYWCNLLLSVIFIGNNAKPYELT